MELLYCPIVDEIELKLALVIEISEQFAQVGVVWCLIEAQITAVGHVCRHFFRITKAKRVDRCLDFAIFDLLILVFFIPCA